MKNTKSPIKHIFLFFLALLCGCQNPKETQIDPIKNVKSIEELRNSPADENSPLPQEQPFRPNTKNNPPAKLKPQIPSIFKHPVTISIGDQLPLKAAFLSLSQQSGIDLQLEADINEKIIYSAQNQPLIDVVHGICELTNLRYILTKNAIQITKDTPYPQTYTVQFLNQNRTSNNKTSIATDIFSPNGETDLTSGNGSNSVISAETNNDFWSELERNLNIILKSGSLKKDPKTLSPRQTKDRNSSQDSLSDKENTISDEDKKAPSQEVANSFSIHRQAGIITVNANSRDQALIASYLNSLKKTTHTQVLIEAKIIEVNLKDEFKAGIDWRRLASEGVQANLTLGKMAQEGKITNPMHHHGDLLTLGFKTDNFSAILNAIQQFGSCKTLSSPRLTVLNNQNAILKVAKNQVYFRLRYDRQFNYNINRDNLTVSSDIQTVPIGLVMSVQPSIDSSTGKITLSLRPTISRLSRSVADPAVDLAYAASGGRGDRPQPSLIPVVDVREIDTLIETKPGKIVVLGGLMESRKAFEENKLPVLGDIPLLGKLVTGQSEVDEVVELVILLKCTLMDTDSAYELNPADARLVTEFTDDPRPIEG